MLRSHFFSSCQLAKIDPNLKILLSCWFTFKFGSIFACWHDEKRWLHSKTILYQYSFYTNVQWAKIISEGALHFINLCFHNLFTHIHIKLCSMKIKKWRRNWRNNSKNVSNLLFSYLVKVCVFWEAPFSTYNLTLLQVISNKKVEDGPNFCGLLRIYEL